MRKVEVGTKSGEKTIRVLSSRARICLNHGFKWTGYNEWCKSYGSACGEPGGARVAEDGGLGWYDVIWCLGYSYSDWDFHAVLARENYAFEL